jgi:DNA-binding response OmpR family regulator
MAPVKVLIVEDSADTSSLLMRVMEKAGYEVLLADEGKSAVKIALLERPHIVLLDIAIPQLDGIEVCRAIRSHPATSHTKVVIVSALNRREDIEEARAVGASQYITKPFVIKDLLETVRTVLNTPSASA